MIQQQPKLSEEGKPLFLLPQPSRGVVSTVSRPIKSTVESEHPVITTQRVPLLGPDGKQKSYEMTTEETLGDGTTRQVGTGYVIPLWLTEEVQEQDTEGNPLYWNTIEEEIISYEAQAPKEITADDPDYIEELEMVYEEIEVPDPPITPAPPSLESQLRAENKALKDQLSSVSADLQSFMDYYFSENPS
jgi:hypothetical protein